MPVISIRFVSFRFVSFHLVSASQGGKERGREKNRVTDREGLVSRLACLGCYRGGIICYTYCLLMNIRLGLVDSGTGSSSSKYIYSPGAAR